MTSEARIVRPYVGVELVQQALSGVSLQFGSQVVAGGTQWETTPQDFLGSPVQVTMAPDDSALDHLRKSLLAGLRQSGCSTTSVELLIVLSTSRLKIRGDMLAAASQKLKAASVTYRYREWIPTT